MDRVLRPVVAGEQTARLGVDVVAVEPDQCPFRAWMPMRSSSSAVDAEVVELAHGVGLQIDADAERRASRDRLEDDARHADLVQRQGRRQSANPAAGDEHRMIGHAMDSDIRTAEFQYPLGSVGASLVRNAVAIAPGVAYLRTSRPVRVMETFKGI